MIVALAFFRIILVLSDPPSSLISVIHVIRAKSQISQPQKLSVPLNIESGVRLQALAYKKWGPCTTHGTVSFIDIFTELKVFRLLVLNASNSSTQ